jgi:hypothetical protein
MSRWPTNRKDRALKLKHLAAAAATAALLTGGAAAITAPSTWAATPSCGKSCIDVYSTNFTNGLTGDPAFVMDVYKQGQNVGQPVILFRTSNTDPAEDFTVSEQGTVNDFYQAGLVTSALAMHYGCVVTPTHSCTQPDGTVFPDLEAYEVEYAPYGAETGLCVGTGATAAANVKAVLQPCGVSPKTVWVLDKLDGNIASGQAPAINGSDTNFSQPFVLTYPADSYPTDKPRPQLYTTNLTGEADGTTSPIVGTVNDNQLFSAVLGPLS